MVVNKDDLSDLDINEALYILKVISDFRELLADEFDNKYPELAPMKGLEILVHLSNRSTALLKKSNLL